MFTPVNRPILRVSRSFTSLNGPFTPASGPVASPAGGRHTVRMAHVDWSFPYPSQRMPVLGEEIVATSQPLAAQAGLNVLRAGGNAVDAALAAAITLTVVEPTSNGIGSDAFALIWRNGVLHGLNASGRSPAAMTRKRFGDRSAIPPHGWDTVTVPGAVASWVELSQRFGDLPFDRLFAPAIAYARRGYLVSPQTADAWQRAAETFKDFPDWQGTFCPSGRPPQTGERVILPDHAATLEEIATTGGESFYSGRLATAIAGASTQAGGLMTADDLAEHRNDRVEPLDVTYRDLTLHELPPNGQGIAALIALGVLEQFPDDPAINSAQWLHRAIEAMKIGFAVAHEHVADPAAMRVEPNDLLTEDALTEHAHRIRDDRAQDFGSGPPRPGGTVYLTTADRDGTMVSFIQSNYMGFGSGVVVPGTGIALQNRGANFSLNPDHPNVVDGGKRPYHTIIPGFVTKDGKPLMSFGVMGGFMQPQGHVQMVLRLAAGENPQAALDAPRFRVDGGRAVCLEPGFGPEVADTLRDLGHDVTVAALRSIAHGGGQAIMRLGEGYCAASDGRRDGQAVGR